MSILRRLRKPNPLAEDAILSTANEDTGEISFRDLWAEYPGFPHSLEPPEVWWRDRYHLFLRRGYRLLPRYHPNWNGSWWRTYDSNPLRTAEVAGKKPHVYEDLIVLSSRRDVRSTMFATRVVDGAQVVLKRVYSLESGKDDELQIMLLVSSPELKHDPSNHCVQMLEWFPMQDEEEPHLNEDDRAITVLPLLRTWMKPPFKLAVEALSFMRQLIEGLVFLHKHNIAHRDIAPENIFMDPNSIFPSGINPLNNIIMGLRKGAREPPARYDHLDVPVKYLYIDFGESVSFPSFQDRCPVVRSPRGHFDFPEMYESVLNSTGELTLNEIDADQNVYDPFPVDVFVLGMVLQDAFGTSFPYLELLFGRMMAPKAEGRPTADECLTLFDDCVAGVSRWQLLRPVANSLHPYYPYENCWHRVADTVDFWLDYLRLAVKAVMTGKGKAIS